MAKRQKKKEPRGPSAADLARGTLIAALALGLVTALSYFLIRGGNFATLAPATLRIGDNKLQTAALRELCGPLSSNGKPVLIEMVYSPEKSLWIEDAAARFSQLCANNQLKLVALPDLEAANEILRGNIAPTAWSPADELALRYVESGWKQRAVEPLFTADKPLFLVQSPLILLIWEDRARVVDAILKSESSPEGYWVQSMCPLIPRVPTLEKIPLERMVPGRWVDWFGESATPEIATSKDELERWGQVKFGHTPPTRTLVGLETLFLMAYDYLLPPRERGLAATTGQADSTVSPAAGRTEAEPGARQGSLFAQRLAQRKDALQKWLRRCEAGVESKPESARSLADAMFNEGPSRYDAVVIDEHTTFELLDQIAAEERTLKNLRVLYPQPTLINKHPVVLFRAIEADRKESQVAARKWIGFLRSQQIQLRAIEYGFRPIQLEQSLRSYKAEVNPFLRNRRYGISFAGPLTEAPRPSGETIQELIALWQDATGRN